MGFLERVYDKSPIAFQNVMCMGSGLLKARRRYGKTYWETREFCREFDTWPLERQLEYQRWELVNFVRFAHANSPFYRRLYQDVDLTRFCGPEDLPLLPIVDKEMLRANIDDAYTISRRPCNEGNTGGTTGKSLTVRGTAEDGQIRMAVLDHFKSRVGFENLKMRRATFNGKHIIPPTQKERVFWRYNAPCKQMIYSSFDLTEEKMGAYVESLNDFKPQAIDGFFTSICDVASYIERHAIPLEFRPIAVFPTSETLTQVGRDLIERVFGCKVYDQYASSEGAPFVCECPNQVKHVELNTGVFEFRPDGEVLVTSFTTHGTPLIRYAIGDRMELAPEGEGCPCGLRGPVVSAIEGRRLDFLYRPDGARINAGNVSNLLKYLPNSVIRSQFRQKRMNELSVLIEVDQEKFKESQIECVLGECRRTFGLDMNVSVQVVDSIPRAASGKFQFIVNEVDS